MNRGLLRGIIAPRRDLLVHDDTVLNPYCAQRPILDIDYSKPAARRSSPLAINIGSTVVMDIDRTVQDHLYWQHASASWPAFMWSMPGGDFAAVLDIRQRLYSAYPASAFGFGIVIANGATAGAGLQTSIAMYHLGNLGLGTQQCGSLTSSSYAGQATGGGLAMAAWPVERTFIGVRYIGGAWTAAFSINGRQWTAWSSFTPNGGAGAQTHIGFGGSSSGGFCAIRSFRIWRSDVPRTAIGYMRRILLPGEGLAR